MTRGVGTIVGIRDLDPLFLRYGLSADLYRTEEEKAAYRERLEAAMREAERRELHDQ